MKRTEMLWTKNSRKLQKQLQMEEEAFQAIYRHLVEMKKDSDFNRVEKDEKNEIKEICL